MTTTNTTTNKTSTKTTPKTNGSTDHSEQLAAHTSPATPPDKKPVTVMLSEQLHRKVKITAELSGVSLSDLIEAQLRVIVKERLPGLLSQLGDEP